MWQGTRIYKWHTNSGACLWKGHTLQIVFLLMKLNFIIVQLFYCVTMPCEKLELYTKH